MNEKIAEIKAFLKSNRITYKELSTKTNIPEGTLKNIFSGFTNNPRIDTIQTIEKAIGYNEKEDTTSNNYYSLEEEELIKMYRNLSPQNREVVLKNFYILLDPNERQQYESLKNIK